MGRLALDSDCLIAVFKVNDKHHEAIVNRLLHSTERIVISTIALSESLVHSYRAGLGEVGKKLHKCTLVTFDQKLAKATPGAELLTS